MDVTVPVFTKFVISRNPVYV